LTQTKIIQKYHFGRSFFFYETEDVRFYKIY